MKDNIKRIPVILGFHRSISEVFVLLGCYAALIRSWLPRFGTVFQDQALQEEGAFWTACALNMESIGCPASSVANYESTLRNVPEERRPRIPVSIPVETKILQRAVHSLLSNRRGFFSLRFCLTLRFQFFLGAYM